MRTDSQCMGATRRPRCGRMVGRGTRGRCAVFLIVCALCAALLPGGVAAAGPPNPPTNVHVPGITGSAVSVYFVNIAFTPPDATSSIVVGNGTQVFDRGVAPMTDTEYIGGAGAWVCLRLAAYNASACPSWTPWLCAEAPGAPPPPHYLRRTAATTSSVSFAWTP